MQQPRLIRQRIWDRLRPVARPDARFHLDFEQFVPDFKDSDIATRRVTDTLDPEALCFVTPDNAMLPLRAHLIGAGLRFIMASYNLRRGFLLVDPETMPAFAPEDLATLDVLERHATALDLASLAELGPIGLVATGASAVSADGIRFGRGHMFLDLEWGIFSHLGLVNNATTLVAITHDVQLVESLLHISDSDLSVDLIATPSRLVHVPRQGHRPHGITWSKITQDMIKTIPPLRELAQDRGIA